MVAVMALMEAPSIVVGVLLIAIFDKKNGGTLPLPKVVRHSVTNGSVLLILGSLVIGFLASEHQAEGIKPFTTDIFKGFLAVFLLDMGITSGSELSALVKKGWFALVFAILIGRVQITPSAYPALVKSVHLALLIFAGLCGLGVFFSLSRGKVRR